MSTLAFRLFFVLAALSLGGTIVHAGDWYASVAPNEELSAPVVWGKTQEDTAAAALKACRELSDSCSTRPAWTDTKDDVFALMCCNKPKIGCAIGVGLIEEMAKKNVQKTFDDAGYSSCKIGKYLSARTGLPTGYEGN